MIEFNGRSFSGSLIKNDESELIVVIYADVTLPDLCLALNGVKTVTETTEGGSASYDVNIATNVSTTVKGIFTITFSKKLTVYQEMSQAIDALLVMALEG